MYSIVKSVLLLFFIGLQVPVNVDAYSSSLTKKEFLDLAFDPSNSHSPNNTLNPTKQLTKKTLWLDKSLQENINQILHHDYPKLRLHYWLYTDDEKASKAEPTFQTIWFLDEIGKEKPISFAVSIINGQVDLIRVLKFRESRGGEIQMLAFSEQFKNIGLNQQQLLNKNIDGITGATMSVSAMKKITRVALMLNNIIFEKTKLAEPL